MRGDALNESPRGSARTLRTLLGLAAILVVVVVIATLQQAAQRGTPTGTARQPASPPGSPAASVPSALRPYRLRVTEVSSSPSPRRTVGPFLAIRVPADCDPVPTTWLRSFCQLTLRGDWRAIVAPTDPFGGPAASSQRPVVWTVSWYATMARAALDGDTSFCTDVSIREWITFGYHLGAAPQPGASPSAHHPVAVCLAWLRTEAAATLIPISDPSSPGIEADLAVDPAAAAHAAIGTPPAFDPPLVCDPSLTRDTCTRLIDAVAPLVSSRAVEGLRGVAVPPSCTLARTCPPLTSGTWLGGVLVGLVGGTTLAFDARDVSGVVTAVQVAYPPSASPSPAPAAAVSGRM